MHTLHLCKKRCVSTEAHFIRNKFEVYRALIIQIKFKEKRENAQNRKQSVYMQL